MSKYEFKSYKLYPEDQYTNASCKIRIDGRFVVTYVQKKMKNGGHFWSSPSAGITEAGEKKFLSGFMFDSQMENEEIIDFIQENVKRITAMPMNASAHTPAGMTQPMAPMQEVAEEQPLPF